MKRIVLLSGLFLLGCAASQVKKIEEKEFSVIYLDVLRPTVPGVRVKPKFKWAESKYLTASFLERSSVLKKVALEAAQEYCGNKNKKAELGTIYVAGEMVLEDQKEQRPVSMDADFSCK